MYRTDLSRQSAATRPLTVNTVLTTVGALLLMGQAVAQDARLESLPGDTSATETTVDRTEVASKTGRLVRGVSPEARKALISRLELETSRRHVSELAKIQQNNQRLLKVLEPARQVAEQFLRTDPRGDAFIRDLTAAAKYVEYAKTPEQRQVAVDAHIDIYERHSELLQDLRKETETAELRDELAAALGIRPSDLGGGNDEIDFKGRLEKWLVQQEPRDETPEPGSTTLILQPPFSITASGEVAPPDPLPLGNAIAWTEGLAIGEFPAQAQTWSNVLIGAPGGQTAIGSWARVGEAFTVPAGFSRLRVAPRISLSDRFARFNGMNLSLASTREVIEVYVLGPDQLFEFGTITVGSTCPPGDCSPSSDEPYPLSESIDVPIALNFDIPETGGEYSVWYLVSSYASGACLTLPIPCALTTNSGTLSVVVQEFEIEAKP